MPKQTCMGGLMKCTMGLAPSTLIPTPKPVLTSGMVAANILDHIPIANIPPFGVCVSTSNPSVAAASVAAGGVLTPMPCVPFTLSPWIAGAPTVLLTGAPALNDTSQLMCGWGGVITFAMPGQFTHMIP